MTPSRRALLCGAGLLGVGALLPWRLSLAGGAAASSSASPTAAGTGQQRLVLVILRGGMDGLDAFPRPADATWRALGRKAPEKATALADGFHLHPSLGAILPWWTEGRLALVPAAGQPASRRSHFDGQDLLEQGGNALGATRDGWLHRFLGAIGAPDAGAAIGSGLPLILRGEEGGGAASVDPARESSADAALVAAVEQLWKDDPTFSAALAEAGRARVAAGAMSADPMGEASGSAGGDTPERKAGRVRALAAQADGAGKLLAEEGGYRVAVLDSSGWDTHASEDTRLPDLLEGLAASLVALRSGLGSAWADTTVVTVTEFGRMAKRNGTGGTDHGTGGPMLVAGGRVRGGRVAGDWPGLERLFEDRDLAIANDVRGVFKGVLAEGFGLSDRVLDEVVFPDSRGARRVTGLLG